MNRPANLVYHGLGEFLWQTFELPEARVRQTWKWIHSHQSASLQGHAIGLEAIFARVFGNGQENLVIFDTVLIQYPRLQILYYSHGPCA